MKIKEMYLTFDKNNELKKGITTFGQASCNLNGCICIENLIETSKELIKTIEENRKKENEILNKWGNLEEDKKDFYLDSYNELEEKENNLYDSYYNIIFAILTKEEVDKIQKQINYNFMSNEFIKKMVELLESKEV